MAEGSIFTQSDLEDEAEKEKRKMKSTFDNEFEEAEFRQLRDTQEELDDLAVTVNKVKKNHHKLEQNVQSHKAEYKRERASLVVVQEKKFKKVETRIDKAQAKIDQMAEDIKDTKHTVEQHIEFVRQQRYEMALEKANRARQKREEAEREEAEANEAARHWSHPYPPIPSAPAPALIPLPAPQLAIEAGPSDAGPSQAGPSQAGPSQAGLSEAGPSYTPNKAPPAHLVSSFGETTTPTCSPLFVAPNAPDRKKSKPKEFTAAGKSKESTAESTAAGEDVFQSKAIGNKRKIDTADSESHLDNALSGKKQKTGGKKAKSS